MSKGIDATGLGRVVANIKANFLQKTGGTMTGGINLASDKYKETNNVNGLDAKNSDIVGLNGLYWNDACDAQNEGIHFVRDSSHWDTLRAYNGNLLFTPYRVNNGTGTDYTVYARRPFEAGTSDLVMVAQNTLTRPNRLSLLPADQIIIEKTTDGGTTWEDAGISDGQKAAIFSGTTGGTANIPLLNGAKSALCGIRITFTAMKYNVPANTAETEKYNYWNSTYVQSTERYCNLRSLWFWVSANNDTIRVYAKRATGANPNNWSTIFNTDFGMTGWSGSDWISFSSGVFGGGTTQTGNYWNWRLEFYSRIPNGKSAFQSATAQQICKIFGYGENVWTSSNPLMYHDHAYNLDASGNATFPKKITASGGITGNLTGNADTATNATKVNNHTVNADVPSGAKFTDTTYTAATAAPGKVASASAKGSSTNYARQDHTHGIDLATGDSNGQVKIAGTNVSVKGLAALAYKASLSASDIPDISGTYAVSGHTHSGYLSSSDVQVLTDTEIDTILAAS